jgi:hypothetical protein
MTADLREWCGRLERLAQTRPTPESRRHVDEALQSKWEGVQVWAVRVLAAWGDRQCIDAIRRWLEIKLSKARGWSSRGEAVKALCQCYEADDVPWLLDLYFGTTDRVLGHEFLPFIEALPEDTVRRRIDIESRSASERRREAATIAARRLEWSKRLEQQRPKIDFRPPARKPRGS